MPYTTARFPGLEHTALVSLFEDVDQTHLRNIKAKLLAGDKSFDFCFINTSYIVSTELLFHSIHKAIHNFRAGGAKAKTLNTEILFNLSCVNNIGEAFKKFGVDDSKATDNILVVKVFDTTVSGAELDTTNEHLVEIVGGHNVEITDERLFSFVDVPSFKKTYKLNDAKPFEETQQQLTRLAIGACIIRGN